MEEELEELKSCIIQGEYAYPSEEAYVIDMRAQIIKLNKTIKSLREKISIRDNTIETESKINKVLQDIILKGLS